MPVPKSSRLIAAVALVAATVLFVGYKLFGSRSDAVGSDSMAFFTTDEGKTLFAGESDRLPPFDHDGVPAVRAYKFSDSKGAQWVQYLQQYSEEQKRQLEAARTSGSMIIAPGMVKHPGDKNWVSGESDAGRQIITPISPNGVGFEGIRASLP